ncbi:hypothetical protein GCM10022403_085380 [Streptomyces coacervatus]|uniref:Uncharacterized protein n=1 Tax=Streptomyces coacervatus TaxID=647381 RepID=A0ABP7JAZ3_9ACTN|nr:hypothetical protein [Streptomyces coacervatus]MDF2271936.1 hypothetical protein [Streptomyces coacervatus]
MDLDPRPLGRGGTGEGLGTSGDPAGISYTTRAEPAGILAALDALH